ncbi:hypothetical protein C2845_PM05G16770 [Panicum miliaceum]|uniref:Transposase MuDR plant domain-containing protein n=1 Tax=Panicum miliaceum TaxID=4540 RepID=A0A3L6SZ58_PANMI|nr:hypothetical protein C2845_PM05G16770 [Panicum miliaceum]
MLLGTEAGCRRPALLGRDLATMEQLGTNDNHIKLIVMVRAYWSLPDWGPKTYRKRETLTTTVDGRDYSLLKFVDFIGENFVWDSKQYISLWRALEDDSIGITTDEQMSEWFELNKDKGEVHIVGQVNDFEGPLQFSPTKRRLHPNVWNFPSTAPIDLDPFINPTQPTQRTNEPTKEDKKVHRKVTDDVLSDSNYDSELAASSNSELDAFSDSDYSNPEYEPDHEIVDEDDNDDVSVCSYDVDAPCADIGCLFHDVNQCKLASTQHAILNDYIFRTMKKDNERYRAKCMRAGKNCKWIIFASTSKKFVGCKVKTNGPKHTCSSVNQCGDTMASNNWVAERVVEKKVW